MCVSDAATQAEIEDPGKCVSALQRLSLTLSFLSSRFSFSLKGVVRQTFEDREVLSPMMKAVIPCASFSGSVLAYTTSTLACMVSDTTVDLLINHSRVKGGFGTEDQCVTMDYMRPRQPIFNGCF